MSVCLCHEALVLPSQRFRMPRRDARPIVDHTTRFRLRVVVKPLSCLGLRLSESGGIGRRVGFRMRDLHQAHVPENTAKVVFFVAQMRFRETPQNAVKTLQAGVATPALFGHVSACDFTAIIDR